MAPHSPAPNLTLPYFIDIAVRCPVYLPFNIFHLEYLCHLFNSRRQF
jgi:hypothetical protein